MSAIQNAVVSPRLKSVVEDPWLVSKRREQLALASIALFSQLDYHSATVKDIAKEAGVSAGLVYQYVKDKQDLLFLALVHITQRNKEEIPAALKDVGDFLMRLQCAIEAYTHVIAANGKAVLLTYRETKSLKREDIEQLKQLELETNALIEQCVQDCIAAGYIAPTNVELLTYRIITAAHAWALKHWRLSRLMTLEQYLHEAIHACWRPLLLPKGRRRYNKLVNEGALRARLDCASPVKA